MNSLAYDVWAAREQPSLEDVLRADPELLERCKRLGFFAETVKRIEEEAK